MTDWNEFFATAHLDSWPGIFCGMSRELFERDEAEIKRAAKRHGYILETKNKAQNFWMFRKP